MDTRDSRLVICHTGDVALVMQDAHMWLEVATNIGRRKGTCTRRNVGAVLLANGRVREIAWNGMEREQDVARACMGGGCPRGLLSAEEQPHGIGYSNCVYLHAEFNALENFRHGQRMNSTKGWAGRMGVVLYVGGVASDGSQINPCEDCVKYADWAGAYLVWYGEDNGS